MPTSLASPSDASPAIQSFIAKWRGTSGSERANAQLFLTELCDLLAVPRPRAATGCDSADDYVFERRVAVPHAERRRYNYIDLYRRGCFVLEAKQSRKRDDLRDIDPTLPAAGWDALLRNARQQAEHYARCLPPEEGWPPFLIVVDIGRVIELYADFSLQGKHYAQFPDRQTYRVPLESLHDEAVRNRLSAIWTDPDSLNPARITREVTQDVARVLARLSRSLEGRLLAAPGADAAARHDVAEKVAMFLMRCLFTMFAQSIGLLDDRQAFTDLLASYRGQADRLHRALTQLWREMDAGGDSLLLRTELPRFNGGLFHQAEALAVTEQDLDLLIEAARRDWHAVEPAIFGTLLENALDPRERHALGAHFTPRAHVERVVVATIIEPLNEEWRNVLAAATQEYRAGRPAKAQGILQTFHRRLCEIRVLDPACGTGNFLYVALELMKRLEGEVLEALVDMGETQGNLDLDRHTVDPHQFLGLEINPRAVAIAELVLWIGYLQWHFRTRGRTLPAQPVLRKFDNIREQDALIQYDGTDILRDAQGRPVTSWDGVTCRLGPLTGTPVPDDTARRPLRTYRNPRPAPWPEADFIIGNPPFIGGKDMRRELGEGYAEACWQARPHIPGGADFVMHFWDKAAETVRLGRARRFGLITTNSITQTFSRRVVARHLGDQRNPLSLAFAVPDHPWITGADRAAVRIAMTVGVAGKRAGRLRRVRREADLDTAAPTVELTTEIGRIWSDLTIGTDLSGLRPLRANGGLCSPGVKLHGQGFIVSPERARQLGLGRVPNLGRHLRPYLGGRDLTGRPRDRRVIDLFGLTADQVRDRFPAVYQHVADHVRPGRDARQGTTKDADGYAAQWWLFGKPRPELRRALASLPRFIATPETAKHRFFVFLDAAILPDNMLVSIAADDALILGVLSSRLHVVWSLAAGGRLGVGNDPRYTKTLCFDPFPFPRPNATQATRIRDLAERLDRHRKDVLARHPGLTMTGLYNVLTAVRAGQPLSDAQRRVYEEGLVGVLGSLHEDLDQATAAAYGWPVGLSDAEILQRLADLHQRRQDAEAAGTVHWLRPAFQAPAATPMTGLNVLTELDLTPLGNTTRKPSFPKGLPDRVGALRELLADQDEPASLDHLVGAFAQGRRLENAIAGLLETLALLGEVDQAAGGYILNA